MAVESVAQWDDYDTGKFGGYNYEVSWFDSNHKHHREKYPEAVLEPADEKKK